jgi:hypothetical protein
VPAEFWFIQRINQISLADEEGCRKAVAKLRGTAGSRPDQRQSLIGIDKVLPKIKELKHEEAFARAALEKQMILIE